MSEYHTCTKSIDLGHFDKSQGGLIMTTKHAQRMGSQFTAGKKGVKSTQVCTLNRKLNIL